MMRHFAPDSKVGYSEATCVCSYVQKHVIDALEGFSQFLSGVCSYLQKHVIDAQEGFSQFLKLGKAFQSINNMFLDITTNTCGEANKQS